MLKHLLLKNFKSFQDLDLPLGSFSVFVGANSAGKSNLLQAFKFMHDISEHGLQNAVAIQGGFKFLRNVRSGTDGRVVVEAIADSSANFLLPLTKKKKSDFPGFTACKATEMRHRLVLAGDGDGFRISEDSISYKFEVPSGEFKNISGSISAFHQNEHIQTEFTSTDAALRVDSSMSRFIGSEAKLGKNVALAFSSRPFAPLSIPTPSQRDQDLDIAYYDFDPRLSKQAVRISGSSDLEESGDNLAVVIQNILTDSRQRERLFERIRDLLPHFQDLDLEHFSDSSLLMSMRERYESEYVFPASLVSNGTVSIVATLIAVLFQHSNIVIMEEPERNIHPYLIDRLLVMMREASAQRQILISTHSPVVLDNTGLESLYLVRRDAQGISRVTRPKDSEIVTSFLSEDFGVGRLYETKLLEM